MDAMKDYTIESEGSDPVESVIAAVAERKRAATDLLAELALAVAANERAQRRFRTAALIRLSKIETMVKMVHGAQIAGAQMSEACAEERIKEHASAAEVFISQQSKSLLLGSVKYIYGGPEALGAARVKRRWKDCPEYEI